MGELDKAETLRGNAQNSLVETLRFGEIKFGLSHMATCWLVQLLIVKLWQHIQIAGTTGQVFGTNPIRKLIGGHS